MELLLIRIRAKLRNLRLVAGVTASLLVFFVVPWAWMIVPEDRTFASLPAAYFFSMFVIPLWMLVIIMVFERLAAYCDRHTVEYENE